MEREYEYSEELDEKVSGYAIAYLTTSKDTLSEVFFEGRIQQRLSELFDDGKIDSRDLLKIFEEITGDNLAKVELYDDSGYAVYYIPRSALKLL